MPAHPRPFLDYLAESIALDDNGCWIWIKTIHAGGYGLLSQAKNRSRRTAHVWVWQHLIGEVPDGLQLDHLCRVRCCVNPDHLEPVTPGENTRRGLESRGIATACLAGHPAAIYRRTYPDGLAYCLECARLRSLKYAGLPIRERRQGCGICGRQMAPQNISRHEAACQRDGYVYRGGERQRLATRRTA